MKGGLWKKERLGGGQSVVVRYSISIIVNSGLKCTPCTEPQWNCGRRSTGMVIRLPTAGGGMAVAVYPPPVVVSGERHPL